MISEKKIEQAVFESLRKTINKFREHPYYFFTESDIQSYLYYCLYSSKFEYVRDGKRIFLLHKEYPTNFRYRKKDLTNPKCKRPIPLDRKEGDRGNYDFVVLNPKFVKSAPSCDDVVNKNVKLLENRIKTNLDLVKKELLFAIEFKYVVRNSKKFIDEVVADNKKLQFSKDWGAKYAINLVCCNIDKSHVAEIKKAVMEAPNGVCAVFVQSYYDENDKKLTPKPVAKKKFCDFLSI